jgi:hypothetical protein
MGVHLTTQVVDEPFAYSRTEISTHQAKCSIKNCQESDQDGGKGHDAGISDADAIVDDSSKEQWLGHTQQGSEDQRDQEQDHQRLVGSCIPKNSTDQGAIDVALPH